MKKAPPSALASLNIGDMVQFVERYRDLPRDPNWLVDLGPGPYEVIGLFKAPRLTSVDALQVTVAGPSQNYRTFSSVWFKKAG